MEATPPIPPLPPVRSDGWLRTLKDSLSGVEYDYTEGAISRGIVMLAIPMILEMLMESAFAVVDVFFVGRLGRAAVAAVGLTESMLTILYSVAIGLSMSVTATVARRIGEKDRRGAAVAASQAIALGIALAAVSGVLGALGAPTLLRWMGGSAEVQEVGSGYTRLLLGSNVVIMLLFINNAVFRGAGDPALAMRSLWLANAINMVLDPCLIFGWGPFPELGLTGAAVATTVGRGTGVLYQFLTLRRGAGRLHISPRDRAFDPKAMLGLVKISLGGIGQLLIATTSWVALMRIMSPSGTRPWPATPSVSGSSSSPSSPPGASATRPPPSPARTWGRAAPSARNGASTSPGSTTWPSWAWWRRSWSSFPTPWSGSSPVSRR